MTALTTPTARVNVSVARPVSAAVTGATAALAVVITSATRAVRMTGMFSGLLTASKTALSNRAGTLTTALASTCADVISAPPTS